MKFLRLSILAFFLLASVSFSYAEETTPKDQVPLVNADVVQMVKAGFSPELVIAKIKASKVNFDTSAPTLTVLKTDDVPDSVLVVMVQASTAVETVTANKPNLDLEAQRAAVKALRKLTASTDVGISYVNYTPLVAQVKAEVEDILPSLKSEMFKSRVRNSLQQYEIAASVWQATWRDGNIFDKKLKKMAVEEYGVKRHGLLKVVWRDELLSAIWAQARTHFDSADSFLSQAQRLAAKDSK
jgi:hypothetical protein